LLNNALLIANQAQPPYSAVLSDHVYILRPSALPRTVKGTLIRSECEHVLSRIEAGELHTQSCAVTLGGSDSLSIAVQPESTEQSCIEMLRPIAALVIFTAHGLEFDLGAGLAVSFFAASSFCNMRRDDVGRRAVRLLPLYYIVLGIQTLLYSPETLWTSFDPFLVAMELSHWACLSVFTGWRGSNVGIWFVEMVMCMSMFSPASRIAAKYPGFPSVRYFVLVSTVVIVTPILNSLLVGFIWMQIFDSPFRDSGERALKAAKWSPVGFIFMHTACIHGKTMTEHLSSDVAICRLRTMILASVGLSLMTASQLAPSFLIELLSRPLCAFIVPLLEHKEVRLRTASLASRSLVVRLLVMSARFSFSFYMWQYVAFAAAEYSLHRWQQQYQYQYSRGVSFALSLIILCIVSLFSLRFIESPVVACRNRQNYVSSPLL